MKPLRLVVLGDSSAAGLGVERPTQTPGRAAGRAALARDADRPVELDVAAVRSARGPADLDEPGRPRARAPPRPDVAVIMIGANDVTHRVAPADRRPRTSAGPFDACAAADVEVVVGTCPDLGTVEPLTQPLR